MEIRIRHIQNAVSSSLHEGTLDEAQSMVAHMRVVGVHVNGNTEYTINQQFVVEDDDAFFEILVGEES